jgi:hypothetical protein
VRLTAHILSKLKSEVRHDGYRGTAFRNAYILYARMKLRMPNGAMREFYTSTEAFGWDKPLNSEGSRAYSAFSSPYDVYFMGGFGIDIDLVPGEYGLQLHDEIHYPGSSYRSDGWNSTGLGFQLRHVTLERVP